MNIEEYLTTLTEQIRCKKARQGVAREIRNHILDQTQAYEQGGMEHDKAVEAAVHEMGDPVTAGAALDRIHRPQFDWRFFAMTILFSAAGIFVMYVTGALGSNAEWFPRQCLFTLFGIGVTVAIYFMDYTFIGKYALPIYIFMSIVFYIYQKTGTKVNGTVPAFRSFVYLYVPVYAGLLYKYRGELLSNIIKPLAFILLTTFFSKFLASSMYVGFCIGAICTILFLYAVLKGWYKINEKRTTVFVIVFLFVSVLFAGYIFFFAADYQKMRIMAFLYPEGYRDANYQLLATRRAIDGARFIGESTEGILIKQFVQQDTFLIFAQVVAMYGLIAGAAIITVFAAFAYRALHVVRHQKNQLGMILSAACFLLVFFNCTTGILMNFGLLPMGSLQFPFLSRGGSGTIMYAVIIGLLMSCRRYEKIIDLSADV
jgi:cell division protein FtsW (lipid II flippase)